MLKEAVQAAHAAVRAEDFPRAWNLLNAILNEDPDNPEPLFLMGSTMRAMGNLGLAYQVLRRALAGNQKQVNLWMTYAATLHDMNRYEEAREALYIAKDMVPNDPMPPANIGATFVQQGNWREAINWCDKAIKFDDDCYIARISRNFAYLSLGRWQDAYRDARWLYGRHLPVRVYNPPSHEEPMWDGTKGKTVVVQADQGVGDIIMFSQMLPQMAADCKEVILETAPRLVNLMKRTFPMITVEGTLKEANQLWAHDRIGTDGQINAHVHISYLGRWYRKKDSDFPRQPYLKVDEEHVAYWKKYLEHLPRPWVGISWKGGIQATQKHLRSINLADLAPIIRSGGTMIDLSYTDNRLEISRWNIDNQEQVFVPRINADDYDATASLIAALDEVVTVTTTVAHVCGALGKRAYVLVPSVPQWRYAYRMPDEGMIWYPKGSVRLFRQAQGEDGWAPAINRLHEDMKSAA